MLTIKKRGRRQIQILLMAFAAIWLAGCMPAGPRALLRGKRLVEQGKYADAIEELQTATSLLVTNAQAWNYLGLAYQHAGQAKEAVDAYQHARRANPDLVVVHYNLGCQLLEMNRSDTLEAARNELTAYTLHQHNSPDGWVKLGTAQLRLSDWSSAEASFKQALQLRPQDVEALNDLGVLQLQRRHTRDAVPYFTAALQKQPNYGPAQLNLAITEFHLNNRTLALQKYQDYLTSNPHAANFDAVNAAAQQLDAELNPPPHSVVTNVVANPATNVVRTNVTPAPAPKPPEPVKVAQNPVPVPQPVPAPRRLTNSAPVEPTNDLAIAEPPPKRGFLTRLFHHEKPAQEPEQIVAPLPTNPEPVAPSHSTAPVSIDSGAVSISTPPPVRAISVPRYPYLPAGRALAGNRTEAERLMARGVAAERDGQLKDAVTFYRSAAQADPGFFDAQNALGASESAVGDLGQALRAYELALTINPDSFNARFNFGLALKRANYIEDAAEELERLLASNPGNESSARLAVVHLTLGNLYSEQFHQNAAAKKHYLKVLELDPHNSQATSIRFWLQNNP